LETVVRDPELSGSHRKKKIRNWTLSRPSALAQQTSQFFLSVLLAEKPPAVALLQNSLLYVCLNPLSLTPFSLFLSYKHLAVHSDLVN
jgi:hypothetical protein